MRARSLCPAPRAAGPANMACHDAEDAAVSGFAAFERYAELVRRRQVAPGDLLEAAIERVEARNPALNAVTMPLDDYGRAAITAGLPGGPSLRGRGEAVAAALADDEARVGKVPGQDQRAGVGVALDKCAARGARPGRVVAEAARPLRLGHLHRPVHEISREDGLTGRGSETDADMARGVADRRLEAEMLVDFEIAVDEPRLAGLDHRHDAVRDAPRFLLAGIALVLPEFPLRAGDHVLGLRERRDPAPVLPARVPADMVHVQMGAQDEVHVLGPHADRGEVVEIGAPTHVPGRRSGTPLVVADTRVDDDRVARGPYDVGLDARGEVARSLVEEVRLEPVVVSGDRVGGRVGQHGRGRERRTVDLDHAGDRHLAELHRLHRKPPGPEATVIG